MAVCFSGIFSRVIFKCPFCKVRTRFREMKQVEKEAAGKESQFSVENEQAWEETMKRLTEMRKL